MWVARGRVSLVVFLLSSAVLIITERRSSKKTKASLELLLAVAWSKKTFAQVQEDPQDFSHTGNSVAQLVASNAANKRTNLIVVLLHHC